MAESAIRKRLERALRQALRARDMVAASAVRSALAAIDNAQAVPGGPGPAAGANGPHFAGTVAGLGEAERRRLSEGEAGDIVRAEITEREAAAREYERSGHADQAARLRREATVLMSAMDEADDGATLTAQIFLETERLVLRRFTVADVDHLVSLDADPDVMRFVTGGVPTSREETENEILPAFLAYYERFEGYGIWAALEKLGGEFLGWFHLRPREGAGPGDGAAPGEAELGYRLRKSAWGRGYATEGSRALIRKGFTEFGVQRVVAEAMAVNLASRRVMEKAGLRLVRSFRAPWPYPIEGDELGDVEYALDKADWERQHQTGHGRPGPL